MKFFSFLKYFFYLGYNWNVSIAWHLLRQEIRGEKKYGINTTGADELGHLEKKGIDIEHSTIYMPASYDLLQELFNHLPMKNYRHLVDIGCGKGRALCVAAHFGVTKLTGIDLSKQLIIAAEKNLETVKATFPAVQYKLLNNDAYYFEIPPDTDCIFMFNPFDSFIMGGVLDNIENSLLEHPRTITVIYINPLEKHLFLEYGYNEIFHRKTLKYLEASVLVKAP